MTNKVLRLLILSTFILVLSCKKEQQFNSEIWKNSNSELILTDYRYNMVPDLINSNILIGKKQNEIKELLGESFLFHNSKTDKRHYLVQEKYSFDIDPKIIYIEIEFDKTNRSSKIKLVE